MKYLKFFENRNSLDEVKNIEYLLTDEGIDLHYSTEGGSSTWFLRIYLLKEFKKDIRMSMVARNRLYYRKIKEDIIDQDFFKEYIDRLQDIFKEIRCGSIHIFINDSSLGVINKNGWFPISFDL